LNRESFVKLLVVDDHPEARHMAMRLLSYLGHEVKEAGTAHEAETYLVSASNQVDIVVMDLLLGNSNGIEVAERMEQMRPGLRVLFMSGHDESVWEQTEPSGQRRAFIGKPFSLETLSTALAKLAALP
jgi:two-component system cell cycle sensor histidine kinase/response regulator CckA